MKSAPINKEKDLSEMTITELIETIKEKYTTPEERLSFINQIPEKDSSGNILIDNLKRKASLIKILF